jgi:L-histidine N-alpha-methyltransferase
MNVPNPTHQSPAEAQFAVVPSMSGTKLRPPQPHGTFRLERHLLPGAMRGALASDVRAGFTATPKQLPPKWFYDARGSRLFQQITTLPEYYPARRERQILRERASEIADLSRAETLIELGSGASAKTRLLLDALTAEGTLARFVPFDVDETVLRAAAQELVTVYPRLQVHAVVGDFEAHLAHLPRRGRRLIAFLGGTIGNLLPPPRIRLLSELAAQMTVGDHLLLGTDMLKDKAMMVAAYDDRAGITAAFNRNVLRVLQRELDAEVDPDAFQHVAVWNSDAEWIEMRLRSTRDQVVRVLDLEVQFAAGEDLRTEISAKFRPEGIHRELEAANLTAIRSWTDPAGDYTLTLAIPQVPRPLHSEAAP